MSNIPAAQSADANKLKDAFTRAKKNYTPPDDMTLSQVQEEIRDRPLHNPTEPFLPF